MKLLNRIINYVTHEMKYHMVNTAAQVSLATPIFAIYETLIARMSPMQSFSIRTVSATAAILGIGYLEVKFRDYMRKRQRITQESSEKKQRSIDKKSKARSSAGRALLNYIIAGVHNISQVAQGVFIGAAYGTLFGDAVGYSMDLYMDLSGVKKSERIPAKIQNMSPMTKKAMMAGLIAASVGMTMMIYYLAPIINQEVDVVAQAIF